MSSENGRCADNQQASRKKISDEYFSGFVDGEGCFYVGFSRRKDLPLGWQIITEFHLSQNPQGKLILEGFQRKLECGYIKPNHAKSKNDKTWVLIVKNRKDLKKRLIPFFRKHPLHSGKRKDFMLFVKVLQLIEKKEHLERKGFRKIVNLIFQLPRSGKHYSKQEIFSSCSLRDYTPNT